MWKISCDRVTRRLGATVRADGGCEELNARVLRDGHQLACTFHPGRQKHRIRVVLWDGARLLLDAIESRNEHDCRTVDLLRDVLTELDVIASLHGLREQGHIGVDDHVLVELLLQASDDEGDRHLRSVSLGEPKSTENSPREVEVAPDLAMCQSPEPLEKLEELLVASVVAGQADALGEELLQSWSAVEVGEGTRHGKRPDGVCAVCHHRMVVLKPVVELLDLAEDAIHCDLPVGRCGHDLIVR